MYIIQYKIYFSMSFFVCIHIPYNFEMYAMFIHTVFFVILVHNIIIQFSEIHKSMTVHTKWEYPYIIRLTVTPHKVVNLTLIRGHVQHPSRVIVSTLQSVLTHSWLTPFGVLYRTLHNTLGVSYLNRRMSTPKGVTQHLIFN